MSVTEVARHVPYLRRYARALTGSTAAGDGLVAAALRDLIDGPFGLDPGFDPRISLFRAFCSVFQGDPDGAGAAPGNAFEAQLQRLDPSARMVYLLVVMEQFSAVEVAVITGIEPGRVPAVVDAVQDTLGRSLSLDGPRRRAGAARDEAGQPRAETRR